MSFWKKIVSALGRKDREYAPTQNFEIIKDDVSKILSLNVSKANLDDDTKNFIEEVFKKIFVEIENTEKNSNNYPLGPINAAVWMSGSELATMGKALSNFFAATDLIEYEEKSTGLWSKATLSVQSHYHHLVGAAMIANADCNRKLKRFERAKSLYLAIINDFEFLIEDWEQDDDIGDDDYHEDDDLLAIKFLKKALVEFLSFEKTSNQEHKELLIRVEKILSKVPHESSMESG